MSTLSFFPLPIHFGLQSKGRPYYKTHMKWLVSLPPTPVDLSFSTRIRITFRKMTMLAWQAKMIINFHALHISCVRALMINQTQAINPLLI